MATKKEKDARLAQEAFNSVFEGARVEGRVPDLKLPQKPPPSSPPPDTQSARKTGLYLLLPHGGFTHPENGHFLMMPKEFKAILSLEKKAVAQVVYEIIDQTIGWEDPEGRGGRREWAKLSLRHFIIACGMSMSQVQRGLKAALNNGYIIRRPAQGEYDYSIKWRDQSDDE